jgi:hypothetical protein
MVKHMDAISKASTPSEVALAEHLQGVASLRASRPPHFGGFEGLLVKHGEVFAPPQDPRPAGIKKERDGYAFENALRLAAGIPGWRYVEGWASAAVAGTEVPLHHAWCLTEKGTVVDPTWPVSAAAYIGIPFEPADVWRFVEKDGHFGIWPEFGDKERLERTVAFIEQAAKSSRARGTRAPGGSH